MQLWDWRRGAIVAERQVAQFDIAYNGLAFTPDGRRIVVAERSSNLFQVDAETLEPIGPRVSAGALIEQVVAGADGQTAIATAGYQHVVVVSFLDGSARSINLGFFPTYVDVSPDGLRLAVGGSAGEAGVMDLSTGTWVNPPTEGHTDFVYRVAYSPDGTMFATSGWDGRVNLWDGLTGEHIASITAGPSDLATLVEFMDDGHTLTITAGDGSVSTWDTRLEQWIAYACSVAARNLTADEWTASFGDRPYRETCPA